MSNLLDAYLMALSLFESAPDRASRAYVETTYHAWLSFLECDA